jgi:hypothetical protein
MPDEVKFILIPVARICLAIKEIADLMAGFAI